jgi:hypothetical protein
MSDEKLLVVVDVESDGPCPPIYSMVSFGAVVVEPGLDRTFYGKTKPLSDTTKYDPEALSISGTTREQHLSYDHPADVMAKFADWTQSLGAKRLTLVSDNPAFDAPWINYYFHRFHGLGSNPFGYSARRIGDIWAGMTGKFQDTTSWKSLRKTPHSHNPVDDARGNAEALLIIMERMKQRLEPGPWET